jgi:putative Holliday junction resolvase
MAIHTRLETFLQEALNSNFNRIGSLLSIDYGTKRVGIAITDSHAVSSSTYCVLQNKGIAKLVEEILLIIKKESIVALIIGLPKTLDNKLHLHGQDVIVLAEKLSQFNIEILLFDERMTSSSNSRIRKDLIVSKKNPMITNRFEHKNHKKSLKYFKNLQKSGDDAAVALLMLNEVLKFIPNE